MNEETDIIPIKWAERTPEQLAEQAKIDANEKRLHQYSVWAKSGIPIRNALVEVAPGTPVAEKVELISSRIGTGSLIGLCGLRGRGKTQIGVELVKRHRGQFTSSASIGLRLGPIDTREQVMNSLCRPSLLVIDEAFKKQESEWLSVLFYNLINRRHESMKDTVLIDNMSPEDFDRAAGDSIVSRIRQCGGVIFCNWHDFRADYKPPSTESVREIKSIYAGELVP